MGKMDIPISDIGEPDQLLNLKSFDRLPYGVQKKTFYTLIEPLEKLGIKQINQWPELLVAQKQFLYQICCLLFVKYI